MIFFEFFFLNLRVPREETLIESCKMRQREDGVSPSIVSTFSHHPQPTTPPPLSIPYLCSSFLSFYAYPLPHSPKGNKAPLAPVKKYHIFDNF